MSPKSVPAAIAVIATLVLSGCTSAPSNTEISSAVTAQMRSDIHARVLAFQKRGMSRAEQVKELGFDPDNISIECSKVGEMTGKHDVYSGDVICRGDGFDKPGDDTQYRITMDKPHGKWVVVGIDRIYSK